MRDKKSLVVVGALCALSLAAYVVFHLLGEVRAARETATGVTRPNGGAAMSARIVAASNAFGFDLFQQLQRQAANENVFFSPLSVSLALAMTYNGAVGETKQAMQRALKIEGMNHAELKYRLKNSGKPS